MLNAVPQCLARQVSAVPSVCWSHSHTQMALIIMKMLLLHRAVLKQSGHTHYNALKTLWSLQTAAEIITEHPCCVVCRPAVCCYAKVTGFYCDSGLSATLRRLVSNEWWKQRLLCGPERCVCVCVKVCSCDSVMVIFTRCSTPSLTVFHTD